MAVRFGAALRQVVRGVAARRWSSVALLVTGLLTVAAATLGPLYSRAAQESVLHDALTSAAAEAVGLDVSFAGDVTQTSSFDTAEQRAPAAGASAAYPTRIVGARFPTSVEAPSSAELPQGTRVVTRDGVCAHVVLVQGRCAAGVGEAMISARTLAGPYGYRLGGRLVLPELVGAQSGSPDQFDASPPPASLTVVGVYRPVDPGEGYWFGVRYFDAALSYQDGQGDTVDAVFVGRPALAGLVGARGAITVDYPLDPDAVRLSDVAAVTATVDGLRSSVSTAADATFTDTLPEQLAGVADQRRKVATGSLLVSLQLAALALLVLFAATGDALDGRGGDVALAKLRGLAPGATLRFLLSEPLLLLLVAVPLGAAVGWAATQLLARTLLVAGVPVVFPGAAVVAAVAAFVGAALAAAVAGRRVLTRPVLEQWRGSRRTAGRGRRALVLDVLLAAAAAAGLVLLATGDSGTWALLAPGLLVLAVSLLGVRALPLLVRIAVPRTRGSSDLGRYLAVRQVGRRPAALRLAVLLAVAVGLAVFAVGGESVAAGNRVDRAHVEVGAPRRVAVQFATGADPVALARTADPDGRWAMVAAQWLPGGGQTVVGAVVGVDTAALPAVAFPTSHGPSIATLQRDVAPPTGPIRVTGTSVALTVTATARSGPAPYVDVVVVPVSGKRRTVRLGTLQVGTRTYAGDVPCGDGCVLAGIAWERPVSSFDPIEASVRVTGLTVHTAAGDRTADLALGAPGGWHARSPDGTDSGTTNAVATDGSGITDRFGSSSGSSAGLEPPNVPELLPVWATPGAVVGSAPQSDGTSTPGTVQDDFGNGYPLRVAGTTAALPGVPAHSVLADVSALRAELPGFTGEAAWSVWLGPDAPSDALGRLSAAGFDTGSVTSASERLSRLGRQGPALALALLLACAIAAAVLAIGATATAITASGRRRSFELAALRVLGVPHRALVRATILEQLALLGTAVVLGVPSGIVAALVAMPAIPQFSDTSPLPLSDVPAVLPIVVIALVFVVLLVGTAVGAGVLLVRAAVPSRLRATA